MKAKKILLIILLYVFYNNQELIGSDSDSNGYNFYGNKFMKLFNERIDTYTTMIEGFLKLSLEKDSNFIKENIVPDNRYFEQFEFIIIPFFFLNSSAEDYKYEDNILDYFEIDTTNNECKVYVFKNKELYYYCEYFGTCGHGGDDLAIEKPKFWLFNYKYMSEQERKYNKFWVEERLDVLSRFKNDLIISVKGMESNYFYIYNGFIKIGHYEQIINYSETDPNKFIRDLYQESLIRDIANDCKPIKK